MPTNEPNNDLPTTLPDDARDDRTAAAVLSDELDETPGGGGLGGMPNAADPLSGTAVPRTGTAPNAPIDVPLPPQALDDTGQNPSATRAVQTEVADEKFPASNPLGTTAVGGDQ